MDIQLKRGLLDVSVLAAIKDEDSYGYKIIKDMKPYMEMSESTLYTILKRLESARKRIEEFRDDWMEIMAVYRFITKEDDRNE